MWEQNTGYAEVIDDDTLVSAIWLAIDLDNPIAYDGFLHKEIVALDEYHGFEFETVADLPGYVVVTFYRVVAKKKRRLRCVLYGPAGYLGQYATASAAFEAAAAHKATIDKPPTYPR